MTHPFMFLAGVLPQADEYGKDIIEALTTAHGLAELKTNTV